MITFIKEKNFYFSENAFPYGKKIIYLNPETYIYFRKKIHLIKNIDHVVFDGFFIIYLLRVFGIKIREQQSFDFSSLATPCFEFISNNRLNLFIIGATDDDLDYFKKTLIHRFPKLNIVGMHNGYFDVSNLDTINNIKKKIIETETNFILVGMGGIKQEIFTNQMTDLTNITVFTCGAFISQTRKSTNYFPKILKTLHLRWVIRFIREPKIIRRVISSYPQLILFMTIDWINSKKTRTI
ncbi:WecB/TagA/CpsF family glycosyltransferase [Thiothrix subterranea]|uniref:WecB/TagA/CpsF family glycosyltransferase n=1 Tax=Thiothrix subterranea TaxID=2735563 RepID=UPI00280A8F8E|nr:WecB/TagA/CpsF family glycosyltransferase [Thiothrix subterranea]